MNVDYGLAELCLESGCDPCAALYGEAGGGHDLGQREEHLPSPFGGLKNSIVGRDGGDRSFDVYMDTKNIAIATAPHKIPKLGG